MLAAVIAVVAASNAFFAELVTIKGAVSVKFVGDACCGRCTVEDGIVRVVTNSTPNITSANRTFAVTTYTKCCFFDPPDAKSNVEGANVDNTTNFGDVDEIYLAPFKFFHIHYIFYRSNSYPKDGTMLRFALVTRVLGVAVELRCLTLFFLFLSFSELF